MDRGESARKKRRIDCISQDAIFAVTDGQVLPKKTFKTWLNNEKIGGF